MSEYESQSRKAWHETIWAQQTLKLHWYYADEFVNTMIFIIISCLIGKIKLGNNQ